MRKEAFFYLAAVVATSGCAGSAEIHHEVGAVAPGGTTLTQAITVTGSGAQGSSRAYMKLGYGAGWPLVTREDLAQAQAGRSSRRTPMASFVQFTDTHIMDPQSASRPEFLQGYVDEPVIGGQIQDIHRPQEMLGAYVTDSMVQRVNSLMNGPITGAPLSCMVSTGDNGDFRMKIELQNYLNLMDGGEVVNDTSGQGYIGLQDTFVHPDATDMYGYFYHPDAPPAGTGPDMYKTKWGFPQYPGILQAAAQNFTATGINMPWFSGFGNHDGEQYGTFAFGSAMVNWLSQMGAGTLPGYEGAMIYSMAGFLTISEWAYAWYEGDAATLTSMMDDGALRTVPGNPNRVLYSSQEFIQMHLNSPKGGHGFTADNIAQNRWYYAFDLGPQVLGLMLDTVDQGGGVDGSIGNNQLAWIEQQVQAVSSKYYDADGNLVRTNNPDKLVVLFSHHNSITMSNTTADPYDPVRNTASQFVQAMQRYPNVVLWVNGHTHYNRVWVHSDSSGRTGGLWEVNTASHIDFPQQSRTIEIADNQDGTLSIFGIMIDSLAPPATPPMGPYSRTDLASISRELAANDPYHTISTQIGLPSDRNVELLIKKPF